ncbi:MspA protein [Tsukamurella tyrosinosolvens]|uniref:MspA protein n=1 Tax=Tsukamurella tyrosinosolvens TaxID=57704 RepID=A0A1H4UPI4_TSUTY|nr:MspA protein [Tsukamurella tyrosinosolvens]
MNRAGVNRAARRGNLEQRRRERGIRTRLWKVAAVGVVGATVVAGGVVAAAPPSADKAPRPGAIKTGLFADTSRALETREGYVIRAWKYGEELRSIIPLGRALNTYEAIVSIAGEGLIEFKDPKNKPKVPIRSASITVGLTLACAATPQNMQLSGTLSNAVNASVTPSLSGTVGATAGGQGGSSGGQGSGSVNGSITPGISGTLGDTVTTSGTMTGTIAPGTSKDFPIAKKSLAGQSGYVVTKETRIAMDSCLGGAQVRAYATATLSTDQGDSAITTYGKPLFIERDNPGPAKNPPKVSEDPKPAPAPAVAGTTIAAAKKAEPVKPAQKPAPAPAAKPVAASPSKPAPAPAPSSSAVTPPVKPAPAKPAIEQLVQVR